MAHEPSDGVLGLEGLHVFKGGDEYPTQVSVEMHGYHRRDLDSWLKIDRIVGLRGLGDADDQRDAAEGRIGEILYPGGARGKTIVYTGRIVGKTFKDMRQQQRALERVAAEARQRRAGSITVVDPAEPGQGFAYITKAMALDIDEEQIHRETRQPTPYQRTFTLGLRAHDPRAVWYPVETELAVPEGTLEIENEGNAPAELFLDIRIPAGVEVADVTVANVTTGHQLAFVGLAMPTAAYQRRLCINFTQRAAFRPEAAAPAFTPNADMMPYLDFATSDWWDSLEPGLWPGVNELSVTGDVDDWDVEWQHTTWA